MHLVAGPGPQARHRSVLLALVTGGLMALYILQALVPRAQYLALGPGAEQEQQQWWQHWVEWGSQPR